MFLHYQTIEENGKEIVAVDIQRGTDRPYYLAKKGIVLLLMLKNA